MKQDNQDNLGLGLEGSEISKLSWGKIMVQAGLWRGFNNIFLGLIHPVSVSKIVKKRVTYGAY